MLHNSQKDFLKRHIGPSEEDQSKMLKKLNYKSLDDLIDNTVPEKIQFKGELNIGESNSEKSNLLKLYWHGLLWNVYTICNFKKYIRKSRLVYFLYTLSARSSSREIGNAFKLSANDC
jgi:hypothetical protein